MTCDGCITAKLHFGGDATCSACKTAPVVFKPRPYQTQCVDALWRFFRQHKTGDPLVVVPTGGGKSWILADFVQQARAAHPSTRVLLATHVKELIEQDAEKMEILMPGRVGIYSAGLKRRELHQPVTVAGIQSIVRRIEELGFIDLMLIDEAHLVGRRAESMYGKVIAGLKERNPKLRIIGFTATPFRLTTGLLHMGDGKMFTHIAIDISVQRLIDEGYLSPIRSKGLKSTADLRRVHTRGGEYIPRELQEAVDTEELIEGALDELELHCVDRKAWIVFCAGVEHAEHVNEALRARGISSVIVTGETPSDERAGIVEDFRAGRIRALCNVGVFTTGFDAPNVDCVVLMRPTQSAGLYVQMVGRGLRLFPGKDDCLVMDFAGCIPLHGPIDTILPEMKDTGGMKKRGDGEAPMKVCPMCMEYSFVALKRCPACDFEFPMEATQPHGTEASSKAILSRDEAPEIIDVDSVTYALHTKEDKPDSICVTYHHGITRTREWVCLEHGGYAARKARVWWRERSHMDPPTDTDDALFLTPHLAKPTSIQVKRDGRFLRVVGAVFDGGKPYVGEVAAPAVEVLTETEAHGERWDSRKSDYDKLFGKEFVLDTTKPAVRGYNDFDDDEIPF